MTRPQPPTPQIDDKQLTRDIAKQLDRRRLRRRMLVWSALLALVAVSALYLRCGTGFGLGGTGQGLGDFGEPGSAAVEPGPRRCAIRVTAAGIAVDGKPMQRDEAVAACKATTGADVLVTGDAREGDGEELLSALKAAGIKDITVR